MGKTLVAIAGLASMGLWACSASSGSGSSSGSTAAATGGGSTSTGTGGTTGSTTAGTSTGMATYLDTRDNQTYPEVVIGSQTWLALNMNYATPSGSFCYGNDPSNCSTYGRLYAFSAAGQACPTGWHLPSDTEWMTLETQLGMASGALDTDGEITARGTNQGTELKEGGSSGFEAKLGGYGTNSEKTASDFALLTTDGYFWTSTEESSNHYVWRRHVDASTAYLYRFDNPIETFAISVRCVMGAASP